MKDLDKFAKQRPTSIKIAILKSMGLYPKNPIQRIWWRIKYRKGAK